MTIHVLDFLQEGMKFEEKESIEGNVVEQDGGAYSESRDHSRIFTQRDSKLIKRAMRFLHSSVRHCQKAAFLCENAVRNWQKTVPPKPLCHFNEVQHIAHRRRKFAGCAFNCPLGRTCEIPFLWYNLTKGSSNSYSNRCCSNKCCSNRCLI